MNSDPEPKRRPILKWVSETSSIARTAIIGGISVAVFFAVVAWAYDLVTTTPPSINLDPTDGQVGIDHFFDPIQRELSEYCQEAAWVQFIGRHLFDRQCYSISFEPHALSDAETQRVPFVEAAYPRQLIEIFIDRHSDCFALELDGDTLRITEADNSSLTIIDGVQVCGDT